MTKLSSPDQVWVTRPKYKEVRIGVEYASKSLDYTFNRMGVQGNWTWYYRMIKIMVGVTCQETLMRKLQQKGVNVKRDATNYRTEDFFDLRVEDRHKIDLKTNNIYPEYDDQAERQHFTLEYLIQNKDYSGSDYRRLFPCLIPDDQFDPSDVEFYIFAILVSKHLQKYGKNPLNYDFLGDFIIARPHGDIEGFLSHKRLVNAREDAGEGIDLNIKLIENEMLEPRELTFFFGYESDGNFQEARFDLKNNGEVTLENLSSFLYAGISRESFPFFSGRLRVDISNNLSQDVRLTTGRNLNKLEDNQFHIDRSMFASLYPISEPFKLHILGWISKQEFSQKKQNYPCYGPPIENRYKNMKGKPHKPGYMYRRATCYYYPNVWKGGLKNSNYYVLPRDLNVMDDFFEIV